MRISTMTVFVGGAVTALVLTAGALASAVPPAASVSTAAEPSGPFDGAAPSLTLQPPRFVIGASIDAADPEAGCDLWHTAIPMEMRWTAGDTGSGLASLDLYEVKSFDEPDTTPLPLDARSYRYHAGDYDSDCGGGSTDSTFQVIARDAFGGSATSTPAHEWVGVWQEDGINLAPRTFPWIFVTTARSGTWSTSTCLCFDGRKTAYTTQSGASITFDVTGARRLALVMPKNTNRGQVSISVDGASPVTVDTYAATAQNRVMVWQVEFPSTSAHKVVVKNNATPGRSRIDVDAVVVQ
jgi:hypothetical protein